MTESSIQPITFDNLVLARVDPSTPIDIDRFQDYDAVIIDYQNEFTVLRLMNEIRSHNDKMIYLLPIFLYKIHGDMHHTIARLSDGEVTSLSSIDTIADVTRKIKSRM